MMNNISGLKIRTLKFGLALFVGLFIVDYTLLSFRLSSRKDAIVLDLLQSDEKMTSELYRLFHGLESDFNFFEKEIIPVLTKKNPEKIKTLISFLNTHPHYFKVRVARSSGQEIFKIVQKQGETDIYEESVNYFDLSKQAYFQDLKQASFDSFFFSSMDSNIVNGTVVIPVQPTIRVSKKVLLPNNEEAVLIINLNGNDIFDLFKTSSGGFPLLSEKVFLDSTGRYVSSYPLRPIVDYISGKIQVNKNVLAKLKSNSLAHGSFQEGRNVIVFTALPLPKSFEKWFIISRLPKENIEKSISQERLTWLFWEMLFFTLGITWFWKSEKKRYKEQVFQVLLDERSEFIQNVSHQLKTPLAVLHNQFSQGNTKDLIPSEIVPELDYLIRVIDDLLLLSHIEAFKEVTFRKENVFEILQEAVQMLAVKANAKQAKIKLDLSDDLVDKIYDIERFVLRDLLKSAFFNILDNAVEFIPQNGGEIQINLSIKDNRINIRFENNGPGIPEEFIPFMFNRFTRQIGQERKGSGLGLSISKKIIQLHQGEIFYVRKVNGACFDVLI